ncbi:cuticle protein 19-like [Periplaneta americana]|uniref:cuticle protein 19-like n=1 Tax=Periplaneta americana TaxID=6978 RepID=UPI0037E8314C
MQQTKVVPCIAVLAVLLATVNAFPEHLVDEQHYDHTQYKFEYAVHDPHTGDVKEQWESRDGDAVKGSYSLKEADGGTRTVEYHADKHNGFVAVVKKAGGHSKPEITYHGAKPHY